MQPDLWVEEKETSRFGKNPEMRFLERHLFRYHRAVFENRAADHFPEACQNPLAEVGGYRTADQRLVREKGYRYGQIAVITGDLPTYAAMPGGFLRKQRFPVSSTKNIRF